MSRPKLDGSKFFSYCFFKMILFEHINRHSDYDSISAAFRIPFKTEVYQLSRVPELSLMCRPSPFLTLLQ